MRNNKTIYIQKYEDSFYSDNCYTAYEGALQKGYNITFFNEQAEVPARIIFDGYDLPMQMMVGSIDDTIAWWKRIGINMPPVIDRFNELYISGHIERSVERNTLQYIIDNNIGRKFIKPAFVPKMKDFPAGVINTGKQSAILFSNVDLNTEILISEPLEIESEYRVFVRKNRTNVITGMKHYIGDPFLVPNKKYVQDLINFSNDALNMPAAYTADFAVLRDGSTTLIEFNDGWSVSAYGMEPEDYIGFLMDRWIEIARNKALNLYNEK